MNTPQKSLTIPQAKPSKWSMLLKISFLISMALAWGSYTNQVKAQNQSQQKEITVNDMNQIKNNIINSWILENQTEINEFNTIRNNWQNSPSRKYISNEIYTVFGKSKQKISERIFIICCLLDTKAETSIWKFSLEQVQKSQMLSYRLMSCFRWIRIDMESDRLDKESAKLDQESAKLDQDNAKLDEVLKALKSIEKVYEDYIKTHPK